MAGVSGRCGRGAIGGAGAQETVFFGFFFARKRGIHEAAREVKGTARHAGAQIRHKRLEFKAK
jgi:hypothetical protein